MMFPILISVSVAPASYFFCADWAATNSAKTNRAAAGNQRSGVRIPFTLRNFSVRRASLFPGVRAAPGLDYLVLVRATEAWTGTSPLLASSFWRVVRGTWRPFAVNEFQTVDRKYSLP